MTKVYDRTYFDRWYRHPGARGASALARKVALALATAEYFLERPVRSVLDIGCGEGRWRAPLLKLRPRLHYQGVDSSEYAVRRYGRARNIGLASFGQMAELRFGQAADLLVCSDVLHYVADKELERGLSGFGELCDGVAFIEVYTREDAIAGDLHGFLPRRADWYRRHFAAAGWRACGPHLYLSPHLARTCGRARGLRGSRRALESGLTPQGELHMRHSVRLAALAAAIAFASAQAATPAKPASTPAKTPSMGELLAATTPADWRPLDADNTLYMDLPTGRVIIELAPGFGPEHAANIKTLVREGYFNNLAIIRSQDNYVVQWGDPNDNSPDPSPNAKPLGSAKAELPPEFTVPISAATPFTPLPDRDGYAPQTGFSNGFPAARDPKTKQTWLTHCYGMVGVARGNEPTSGSGTSLYAIIGGPARSLDRNIAVAGRVVQGMELLSVIPRGPAPMGFYDNPAQRVAILKAQMASDLPEAERTALEVLRTDTPTWNKLVSIRRHRFDDWYKAPADYVDVCNVPIPVRPVPKPDAAVDAKQ